VPTTAGVSLTEQLLVAVSIAARPQLLGLRVPPSLVNVTVPVGAAAPDPSVSLAVTVHVVELPTGNVLGAQLTLVVVERAAGAILATKASKGPPPNTVRKAPEVAGKLLEAVYPAT